MQHADELNKKLLLDTFVQLSKREPKVGETWYLISKRWLDKFNQFCRLSYGSADPEPPGPIDNSSLLGDDLEVPKSKSEYFDYVIISQENWDFLRKLFGGGPEIPRKAMKEGIVEIRPPLIVCSLEDEDAPPVQYRCSKMDKVRDVKIQVLKGFSLLPKDARAKAMEDDEEMDIAADESTNQNSVPVGKSESTESEKEEESREPRDYDTIIDSYRLFKSNYGIPEELEDDNELGRYCPEYSTTIQLKLGKSTSPADSNESRNTEEAGGTFYSKKRRAEIALSPIGDGTLREGDSDSTFRFNNVVDSGTAASPASKYAANGSNPSYSYPSSSPSFSSFTNNATAGLCGLSNLGNTCFMNSGLQCLSSTKELREYMISGKFQRELNPNNPLGTGGALAKAFARLIAEMWKGCHNSLSPREFRHVLVRHVSQFDGFGQQDSQELVSSVLDLLHEDLNRILQKPYIEIKESEGRPDKEIADESWSIYKQRNDSIIVDLFQGQYKSTVRCPKCPKISVTFDPYMYLTLPLNKKPTKAFKVLMCYYDANREFERFGVKFEGADCSVATMGDVKKIVSKYSSVPEDSLILLQILDSRIARVFQSEVPISQFERGHIVAYEVPSSIDKLPLQATVIVPCYHRVQKLAPRELYSGVKWKTQYFGIPFLLRLPRHGLSYKTLNALVSARIARYCYPSSPDPSMYTISIESKHGVENIEDLGLSIDLDNSCKIHLDYDYNYHLTKINDNPQARPHQSCRQATEDVDAFSLYECLEGFSVEERLGENDQWYCSSCKEHRRAYKKLQIWSASKYLIVHLKRFSNAGWRREKISALVDFPIQNFDMTPYVLNHEDHDSKVLYDLYAVVNHYGGMGGGHYTAYCKNENSWYDFDDSRVSKVDEDEIVSKAAYLLFYQRK